MPAAFFFCWLSVNGIKGAFEEVNHDGVLGANNNQVYHVKIFRRIKECNIKFRCISGALTALSRRQGRKTNLSHFPGFEKKSCMV